MSRPTQPSAGQRFIAGLLVVTQLFWLPPSLAANLYWDPDENALNNGLPLSGLGGDGVWNLTTQNWWDGVSATSTSWSNLGLDTAVFAGASGTTTLGGAPIVAGGLVFDRTNVTLQGGTLSLQGEGVLNASLASYNTIESLLTGNAGLTKTGRGTVVLTNAANSYSGATSVSNGTLAITSQSALGASTSNSVTVTGTTSVGGIGGNLTLLSGWDSTLEFSRPLILNGGGTNNNGSAFSTIGNVRLTGSMLTSPSTNQDTRISSYLGTLQISGLVVNSLTHVRNLYVQGAGNVVIDGVVTGTGGFLKTVSVGGMELTNPLNDFSGPVRIDTGSLRVAHGSVLGTSTSNGALTIGGSTGTIEFRTDAPDSFDTRRVTMSTGGTGTLFVDHSVLGMGLNQTVIFSALALTAGSTTRTLALNGRNGYGMTFTGDSVGGAIGGNNTISISANGLVTFDGNFWNNTSSTARTLTMTVNTGAQAVITGSLIASGGAHVLTKGGAGTLTILGNDSTYTGVTTISAGTLAVSSFGSLNNNNSEVINIGATTAAGVTLNIMGADLTPAQATTTKPINLAGTTGGATILANQTGASAPIIFDTDFTATGAGAKTLTLGGANTLDNEIRGIIPNSTGLTHLTKTGAGTWVLAGPNGYSGATTVTNGVLKLKANGAFSNIVEDSSTIIFNADTATLSAGGIIEYVGEEGVNNVETLGALAPTAGAGSIRLTPGVGGTASLFFSSFAAVTDGVGYGLNIAGSDTNNTVTLNGVADGLVSPNVYFGGADFAYAEGGVLRAPIYGTDAGFATSDLALTGSAHNEITGSFSTDGALISSLKISGSNTLTLNASQTLTIMAAAAGSAGGILATGGASTITGGTGVTTDGAGALVIRVDDASDTLTLATPVTSTAAGGLTKNGAGTLIIAGVNAQTGATIINEGTVQLSGSGRLSANSAPFLIRQGAILDLNGLSTSTSATAASIGTFNGAGTITNTSANPATLAVGGGTSGGTGTFTGSIDETNGRISVIKVGTTNSQTWTGISNYTGSTTIGVPGTGTTGVLTVSNLANIGEPSGIGRGDATSDATNAASLVFGGTTGGLSYNGNSSLSIDRLFTLAGTATGAGARFAANSANHASIIWNQTVPITFASGNNAAQTLTFSGTSIGDNRFNLQIINNPNSGAATSVSKLEAGLWILGNENNSYTGTTTISGGGVLRANDGGSLPQASHLLLGVTTTTGTLETSGVFTRTVSTTPGLGTMAWNGTTGGGGFAASTGRLVVALGGAETPTPLTWGVGGFVGTGGVQSLILGSTTALFDVEMVNDINLNGAVRTIQVNDNVSTAFDFATLSGVISGAGASGITKSGNGYLQLLGANTYAGNTSVNAGALVVTSIGGSAMASSSLGSGSGSLNIGNTTTAGTLIYVGTGEVTDRQINMAGTTGGFVLDASGGGPLVLTKLSNTGSGAKTLTLQGQNTDANEITANLANNGGNLTISKVGGGTWILSGNNSAMSGNVTAAAGALGIGHNNALGSGTLVLSNASIFAHGDDRTVANNITHNNNTVSGFIGDYSLTFTGNLALAASSSNPSTTTNNIAADKFLSFNTVTANSISAARTWTINGSGNTIINGNITTSTAFPLHISYSGNGTLALNGSNTTGGNTTINNAAARVIIAQDNAFGTGTLTLQAGTLMSSGGDRVIANNVTQTTGTFIIGGDDKFTFNGSWLTSGGTRTLTAATPAGVELTGTITLGEGTSNRTQAFNGSGDILISGVIQNNSAAAAPAGAISYTGNGTLTLSGANTYTGTTTLNNVNGTLRLTGAGKLSTGNLTVTAGTLLIESVDQSVSLLTMGNSANTSALIDIGAGLTLTPTAITFSGTTTLASTITGAGTLALGASEFVVTVADNITQESDMVWTMNSLTGSGTLTKAGNGTLDIRGITNNAFTGSFQLDGGTILGLGAFETNIALNGGVYQDEGLFDRSLGTGNNQVQWLAGGGGFAAFGGDMTVTLAGAPDPLVWGGTEHFAPDGAPLVFGSTSADSVVEFTHDIDFGGGSRTVTAIDNTTVTTDKAILSGNLTNGTFTKTGNGILELQGNNSFTGTMTVSSGLLQFSSLANFGGNASLPLNLGGGALEFMGTDDLLLTGAVTSVTTGIGNTGAGSLELSGAVTMTGTLTLSGTGPISLSGTVTNSGGTRTIAVTNTGGVTLGNVNLSESNTARTLNINVVAPEGTVTIDGVVGNGGTGGGNLTKQGEGHLIINNTSTFTGALIVQNGLLTLNQANHATGGGLQLGGGPTGSSAELIMDADYNLNNSFFYLNANNPLMAQINGTGTINLHATRTFEIRPSLNASRAEAPTPDIVINVPIANGAAAAGITKSRNGVLVLAGNNTYTGTTSINEGVLRLDYSTNTGSKIAAAGALAMTGAALELIGHSTTDVTQSTGAVTIGAGFNRILVDASAGASVTLQLNGALTSTAVGRSADFTLIGAGAAINAGGTGWTLTNGILGGWATHNSSSFATLDGSNNIVAFSSTAVDDVASWSAGQNVTDNTGFSGATIGALTINSLVFKAGASSIVTLGGELDISSGGILIAPSVGANANSITGGQLVTAGNQLFVHQHNTDAVFTISSAILGSASLTKNGEGELLLDSAGNHYSGVTRVNKGTLSVAGGNAIGDYSGVIMDPVIGALLRFQADETIGTLSGGGLDGGNVDVGTHNVTLNLYANSTFSGQLLGSGSIFKTGNGTLTLNTIASPGFSGNLVVNQGQVILGNRDISNFTALGSLTLNNGTVVIDLNGGTGVGNKIGNSTPVTLINTGGIDGLRANNDQNGTSKTETVGAMTLLGGANTITASQSASAPTGDRVMTITTASMTRANQATLLVRGNNLGTIVAGVSPDFIVSGRVVSTALPAMVGGAGGAGTTSINIVPWAVGSTTITGTGESFVTAVATTGFRPLDVETEYEQLTADGGVTLANNVRYSSNDSLTLDSGTKNLNALLVDNTSVTEGITLNGGGGSLHVQSGAFLFTGEQGVTLDGFSGITAGVTGALREYIFHVSNSADAGVTIASPLTSAGAAFTKSGPGTLILTSAGNTYAGQTAINQGVLQIDALNKLGSNGSGGLMFNGGTLRFGGVFDPSAISVTFGISATDLVQTTLGGTFDTNGFDITLANSIGNGGNGGFTKAGEGTLTLNAPVNYQGITTVSGGVLAYGVSGALPATANVVLDGGRLDFGGFAATLNDLTVTANSTLTFSDSLTFTGNIVGFGADRTLTFEGGGLATFDGPFIGLSQNTSSRTLTFAVNAGSVVVNSTIVNGPASASAFTKTGAGSLELTARNFYNGATTIGSSTLPGGTVLLTGSGTVGAGNLTITNGSLLIQSVDQTVATLSMGGGPAGTSALIDIAAGLVLKPTAITFSATNNNLTAVIGGEGTLDLGTSGITVTVNNSTAVDIDMSWEMDTVIGSGAFIKAGAGTLDIRGVTNFLYDASSYQVNAGAILGLDELGVNLVLNGGVYEGSGTFTRSLGTGPNQVQWFNGTGGGGFSAFGGDLEVTLGGAPAADLVWGQQYFVPSGAPLIFGSVTADSVVTFTHNIDLNGAVRSLSAIDNPFETTDYGVLSGVLSNGGLNKIGNGVLRLSGANTFSGTITVTAGTLEFSTVSDNGGGPSNLGQGTDGITLSGGALSFVGDDDQSTDRAINTTASSTLAADGGGVITYTGAITQNNNNSLTLRGSGSGGGVITGGITQPAGGATADLIIASGNWTITGAAVTIADDLLVNGGTLTLEDIEFGLNDDIAVTGDGTVLNLNTTGVWKPTNPAGTSSGLFARGGGVININADNINGVANANQTEYILLGDTGGPLPGILNLNGVITLPRLDVGQVAAGLEGIINGTGTMTVVTAINLYRGSVAANLSGTAATVKNGRGDVELSGDNSGLTGTTALTNGLLKLNYASSNTRKIGSGALTMNGAGLIIQGNASGSTVETVNGMTVGGTTSAGSSFIEVNPGAGQQATLNLGAITRTAIGGTMNFELSSANAFITTDSVNPDGMSSLGGWAVVNASAFATVSGGNIVALTATAADDVTTWQQGGNVTDLTGYAGTRNSVAVNSVVFNAAAGSALALADDARLQIGSGGILVTANAGAGGISGGSIASGLPVGTSTFLTELVIHQYSTNDFTLTSRLNGYLGLTKSGPGTLIVDGQNNYSGQTSINEGTLSIFGGQAIGDRSVVNLKNHPSAVLELNNSAESIAGLTGGGVDGGTVNIGSGTLTLNNLATNVFLGTLKGDGTLVKNGASTQELEGNSLEFTGHVIVNAGLLHFDNANGKLLNAASFTINGRGEILSDQEQSSSVDHIGTGQITLNNTMNQTSATATSRGLWLRNENQNGNRGDTVGHVVLGAGHNVIQATTNAGTNSARVGTLSMASLSREGHATLVVRGQNLGAGGTIARGRIVPAVAPDGMTGGAGVAGSTNISIIPYIIGQAGVTTTTDTQVAGLTGNSFVTWVNNTEGLRPLNIDTEYVLDETGYNALAADTRENVRFAANPSGALTGGSRTINSLVLDSSAAALAVLGAGGDTLTLAAGALLATTATPANGLELSGFGGIATSSDEYLVYVTNQSSTFVIGSPLTSAAVLTKSGAGTLSLTNAGNAFTDIYLNQGAVMVNGLNKLGTGALFFSGGALRLDTGFTDDLGGKEMHLLSGGGTLDMGAINATATNLVLTGSGPLTKIGTGTLTIGDSLTLTNTGLTTVAQGTLVLSNTLGNSIGSGGLLISGTSNPTIARLGASNQIDNGALVELLTTGSNTQMLDLNNFNETIGGLSLTSSTSSGAVVKTGASGVLTVNGDIILYNNRSADTSTTEFQVLITGSGAVGTRTVNGFLDLGGADRRIVVETTQTTPGFRHDAVIETVIQNGGIIKEGSRALYLRAANTYSGATQINEGMIVITAANNLGDGSVTNTLGLTNGGVLRSTGAAVDLGANRSINLGGSGGQLDVTGTNRLTVSGVVAGSANSTLFKTGSGTLLLTAANSFSGGVVISGGVLLAQNITGSATGSGGVTVDSGATLGGTGTVAGEVSLSGILAPGGAELSGNSLAGQLTVGSLAVSSGGTLEIQLGGATVLDPDNMALFQADPGSFEVPASWTNYEAGLTEHDQLYITDPGAPDLTGLTIFVLPGYLNGFAPTYGHVFQILDWASLGTNPATGAPDFNLPALSGGYSWETSFFNSHGVIAVIPEPSRLLLLFFGLLGLTMRRRRRAVGC